jgi:KUP system potassium uptake protein
MGTCQPWRLAQGSYLLANPSAYDAMFWKCLPSGTFWPMFVVATMAAIIASQALISAVFQIVSQAIKQGFLPRFHVYHTSREVRPLILFCEK